MLKRIREIIERGRNDKLERLLKENENDFNFKLSNYFFTAIVLATIGCLFFNQAFWFVCITIGITYFSTLLGHIHNLDDKTVYDEFINMCTRKEGVIFSIIMIIAYSLVSLISIFLLKYTPDISRAIYTFLNYEPNILDKIFSFLIKPIIMAMTIMTTSLAISSIARLIFPLVIKKSREDYSN